MLPLDEFNLLLDSEHEQACQQLVHVLGITPVTRSTDATCRFLLIYDHQGRLGLIDCETDRRRPYYPKISARPQNQGIDPLMRAIGYRASSVVDCTGGWGIDAAHIASYEIPVVAVERHPVVHALVNNALKRCDNDKITKNLLWLQGNSVEYLEKSNAPIEVIYIDPMYPPRPGSAASKKPLQLLQLMLAEDQQDHVELLKLALRSASRRVVVKRPHYAAPLLPGNTGSTESKLVRFDIYPTSP